jgi:hypothetical protein
MRSLRAIAPLAVAASLVAVSPAAADAKAPAKAKAKAAGTDAVQVIYPSLVQVRIGRTERALERATRKVENNQPVDESAKALKVVRRQLAAAWRGTKYVIRTAPPPPVPAEDARVKARKADDDAAGPVFASPPETAFRVLTLQHDVASAMVALIDGSHGAGLNALATTLNQVNDRREQALQYILGVEPPVPPDPEAEGGEDEGAVPTFASVMPPYAAFLDDELQAITGTLADATDLTAGGRRLLNAANAQVSRTKSTVSTNWPIVVAED